MLLLQGVEFPLPLLLVAVIRFRQGTHVLPVARASPLVVFQLVTCVLPLMAPESENLAEVGPDSASRLGRESLVVAAPRVVLVTAVGPEGIRALRFLMKGFLSPTVEFVKRWQQCVGAPRDKHDEDERDQGQRQGRG